MNMTLTPKLIADISRDIKSRPLWASLRLREYRKDNPMLVRILTEKAKQRVLEYHGSASPAAVAFESRDENQIREISRLTESSPVVRTVFKPTPYRDRDARPGAERIVPSRRRVKFKRVERPRAYNS